jgi:hypothetical protein
MFAHHEVHDKRGTRFLFTIFFNLLYFSYTDLMFAHHEVDDKRGTSAYSRGAVHKDLAAASDGPEHELVGVVQVSL